MELKHIQEEYEKLSQLLSDWISSGKIIEIERDLALEKLRRLYDAIRFASADAPTEQPAEMDVAMDAEALTAGLNLDEVLDIITIPSPILELEEEPEPESTMAFMPEIEPEPAKFEVEPLQEQEQEQEQEPEPEHEVMEVVEVPVAQKPHTTVKSVTASLFGEDDVERRLRKQRIIMSLYDTEETSAAVPTPKTVEPLPEIKPQPAPTPKPTTAETPALQEIVNEATDSEEELVMEEVILPQESAAKNSTETETETEIKIETEIISDELKESVAPSTPQGVVLGDVMNHGIKTLSDTFTPSQNAASSFTHHEPVTDLRKEIGINDKFLLIRDLFGGNTAAYDKAVNALNEIGDLDDCMIYIAENYSWNPNSDGAKLMMALIERKFA
ncbi:MAG: hypothetical protein RRY23_05700 [Alistipes sp.]